MIWGNKDYTQPFKDNLTKYLMLKKTQDDIFIFYVIYKDKVKKFIIDFNNNGIIYITEKVLGACLLMALDNNCELEDLIITEWGELIVIWKQMNYTEQ